MLRDFQHMLALIYGTTSSFKNYVYFIPDDPIYPLLGSGVGAQLVEIAQDGHHQTHLGKYPNNNKYKPV